MVVERFPPETGGSGVRFLRVAERLSREHSIDLFTVGKYQSEDFSKCFNVHRFDVDRFSRLESHGFNRVTGLGFSTFYGLLSNSYDVLDIDIWPMLPVFSARIAEPRTPLVISWNVVWPFSFQKTISNISTLFARTCAKLSNYNITVSNFAKAMLLRHVQMSPSNINVIPDGVDEAFFKAQLKPKWGHITFVGRLVPQKRLDLILEGFKIFKKNVNNAELHIVGTGPLKPQLALASKRIDGLFLHESIRAGNTGELISLLSKSWIFVSASEFETYGMSISEALAMGLPVIVTNAPYNAAVHETARQDFNSLIVEHNQPIAIANALEKLYKDHELWDKLSSNARRFSIFHSWDEVAERVEAVYKKAIIR